jgi:hypothetical protein
MHPFKEKALQTHKSKTGSMGHLNNLDIPVMRAVGENSPKKLYSSSTGNMQNSKQSDASGYKRGGHVGKHRSKPKAKIAIVAPPPDAAAPPPDAALAGAGAAPSMPPPGAGAPPVPGQQPMAKKGGRFARGGRAYPEHGGAANGDGRLDLAALQAKKKK